MLSTWYRRLTVTTSGNSTVSKCSRRASAEALAKQHRSTHHKSSTEGCSHHVTRIFLSLGQTISPSSPSDVSPSSSSSHPGLSAPSSSSSSGSSLVLAASAAKTSAASSGCNRSSRLSSLGTLSHSRRNRPT
ncbi:hypothetical protein GSI_14037 [Ganoderma sinense ZZ0214-1]|uniref:Uncharacterized protein n=1 Tax=Ganoderma sinense ZZ0214-1 TaxID=1077348 RepID=A0A2G8RRZ2_9APHY|nr:hypothetical protein GSI_14037 [Ganoderma sinense ZZ0214-1]